MTTYRVHARGAGGRTLCNQPLVHEKKHEQRQTELARWPEDITCQNCLDHYYKDNGARL